MSDQNRSPTVTQLFPSVTGFKRAIDNHRKKGRETAMATVTLSLEAVVKEILATVPEGMEITQVVSQVNCGSHRKFTAQDIEKALTGIRARTKNNGGTTLYYLNN